MEASSYTMILKEPGTPVCAYNWKFLLNRVICFLMLFSVLRCSRSPSTSHTWHCCPLGPNLMRITGHCFSTPKEPGEILKLGLLFSTGKSRRTIYCCFSQFQDYSFGLLIQIPGFSVEFINHKLVLGSPWFLCIFDVLLLAGWTVWWKWRWRSTATSDSMVFPCPLKSVGSAKFLSINYNNNNKSFF